MEMEKQTFDKQKFSGPCGDKGTRSGFECQPLPSLLPKFFVDSAGDGSIPGIGPCLNSFRQLRGKLKVLPKSFVS